MSDTIQPQGFCKVCAKPLQTEQPEERNSREFTGIFVPDEELKALEAIAEHLSRENVDPTVLEPEEALCDQCAAEFRRPELLADMTAKPLTPREQVSAALEHEGFVTLMTDEELEAHILDVRRKMEFFRIYWLSSRKVKAERYQKKMALLTPEELDQYRRQAHGERPKKAAPAAGVVRSTKRESAIQAMMKAGITREAAEGLIKGLGG